MMTLATPKVTIPRRIGRCIKRNAKKAFTPLKLAVGAGIIAVDQASKFIVSKLSPESIHINPGTGFGTDANVPYANQFFMCETMVMLPIFTTAYIASQNRPLLRTGFGLLIAGNVSNLIDRFHAGGGIDFINLGITDYIYNIADATNKVALGFLIVGLGKLGIKWIKNRYFSGGIKNVS